MCYLWFPFWLCSNYAFCALSIAPILYVKRCTNTLILRFMSFVLSLACQHGVWVTYTKAPNNWLYNASHSEQPHNMRLRCVVIALKARVNEQAYRRRTGIPPYAQRSLRHSPPPSAWHHSKGAATFDGGLSVSLIQIWISFLFHKSHLFPPPPHCTSIPPANASSSNLPATLVFVFCIFCWFNALNVSPHNRLTSLLVLQGETARSQHTHRL